MKVLVNIIKWTSVTIGAVLVALVTLSFIVKDRVVGIFLTSVNKNLSTRVETGEYRLSLLRKFPKASIELRNVRVFSSKGFDRSQFGMSGADTLLTAKSAFLEFAMTDIVSGNYNIGSITIDRGKLNLMSDSSGGINYDIAYGGSGSGGDEIIINLDKIVVSDLEVRYLNKATNLDISGLIRSGRFKSRIAGSNLDFICNSSLVIKNFGLYANSVKTNAEVNIDLNLHQSDSGIIFRKGNLRLEDFRFGITGSISSSDNLDLRITGQNIQLSEIMKYLPEKYESQFAEYSPDGILKTECAINGKASRKENPGITLTFSLDKGKVLYRRSNISVRDLSFKGSFSNGRLRRPESYRLDIEKYRFTIGSAAWSGNLSLTDFTRPDVDMIFSGEIIPAEVLEFISVPEITYADGSMRVNLSLSGRLEKKQKYGLTDLLSLDPKANIWFNSLSVGNRNNRYSFNDIDGNIMVARNLWAEDLYFSWLGQRFRVNGEFMNLPGRLAGEKVKIRAVADIAVDNLNPPLFEADSSHSATKSKKAVRMPEDIEADISFRINNLSWGSFRAENVSGLMQYKPGKIGFSSLSINALDGSASGNFLVSAGRSGSFTSQGSFLFENIDINRTFSSFHNFGQDFIKAENLAGSLTGNLTILMPLDSLLNPIGSGVKAEGKYVILNGALKNFEPVKELSGFIEISELENITFSKLENDLFIQDRFVAIPQMEIKSSAADFTVNGKHYFDDSYEYHVKTYLSLLLSNKIRKTGRESDEFGAIEEDGLGRTSVFLKLAGKDEDIKVSYDLKAAGNNVKQSLKKEKGNLRSILNEEYGWFKSDSTIKPENPSRTKFRISFPETDTIPVIKDSVNSEKERKINRFFRNNAPSKD